MIKLNILTSFLKLSQVNSSEYKVYNTFKMFAKSSLYTVVHVFFLAHIHTVLDSHIFKKYIKIKRIY